MIYLAQPYTHELPSVMLERFEAGVHMAALLMARGHVMIAPIVHSHPVFVAHPETSASFDQWQKLDETLILASSEVWVLCIDGWRKSYGVSKKIDFAEYHGIPIRYIDADGEEVETP